VPRKGPHATQSADQPLVMPAGHGRPLSGNVRGRSLPAAGHGRPLDDSPAPIHGQFDDAPIGPAPVSHLAQTLERAASVRVQRYDDQQSDPVYRQEQEVKNQSRPDAEATDHEIAVAVQNEEYREPDEVEEKTRGATPDHLGAEQGTDDDDKSAGPFGPHSSVAASSAHHDMKLLKNKAPSAAGKEYGYSFVDKAVEKGDVATINKYMQHVLDKEQGPFLDDDGNPVTHAPATHQGSKPGMIQFQVNGRVYSTHADTSQLFPVSGDGIVHGKGPVEMMAELAGQSLLDDKTFYQLECVRDGTEAAAWAQVGKTTKQAVAARLKAYLGKKKK
jgi:hypothetical protein